VSQRYAASARTNTGAIGTKVIGVWCHFVPASSRLLSAGMIPPAKYFKVSPQTDGGFLETEVTKVVFELLCSRSLDFAVVENKVIWPDEHDSLLSNEQKESLRRNVSGRLIRN
jgi:hypothetical protein